MNSQAVEAEQLYRRPIMAAFHGMFSVGGVLGSVIGFGTLALDLPPYVTLSIASAIGLLAVWLCSRPPCSLTSTFMPKLRRQPERHTADSRLGCSLSEPSPLF